VKVILASRSPRRRALLRGMGFSFVVKPSCASEETALKRPSAVVKTLALRKARDVAAGYPDDCVIGADTVVFCKGEILGKPQDCSDALRLLNLQNGSWQSVYTGVAVINRGKTAVGCEVSRCKARRLGKAELAALSLRHHDKAGAYAVQDDDDRFIAKISGSKDNVVGLPCGLLRRLLRRAGALSALCVFLAAGAQAGGADNVYFLGAKGESAVENLHCSELTEKERNKWKADQNVYRYHVFLAVALNSAEQNLRSARASEVKLYDKLKWTTGGAGGELDLPLLASLESARKDIASFYAELAGKTSGRGIPPAFAVSNAAFAKYAQSRAKDEAARSAALSSLISGWRDALGKTPAAAFPVKKVFDSLNAGDAAQTALYSGWQKVFVSDCEKYFGRKFSGRKDEKH